MSKKKGRLDRLADLQDVRGWREAELKAQQREREERERKQREALERAKKRDRK